MRSVPVRGNIHSHTLIYGYAPFGVIVPACSFLLEITAYALPKQLGPGESNP
jgi:hypothetical protein